MAKASDLPGWRCLHPAMFQLGIGCIAVLHWEYMQQRQTHPSICIYIYTYISGDLTLLGPNGKTNEWLGWPLTEEPYNRAKDRPAVNVANRGNKERSKWTKGRSQMGGTIMSAPTHSSIR